MSDHLAWGIVIQLACINVLLLCIFMEVRKK
jgi:hypothetical protein